MKRHLKHFLAALISLMMLALSITAFAAQPASIDLEDGEYSIELEFSGGSGRSSVTSPATLIVQDGLSYARIEWSSANYDYMKVGDETYLPVNEEGNSVFEIPITVFDEPMDVIGDTTAMSTPHEVDYQLTFLSDTISGVETASSQTGQFPTLVIIVVVIVILIICVGAWFIVRKRKQTH